MQDKTIIEFQNGDKESYRTIFNLLYPVMCLFARKFINDYDDAEDVVQEVFVELWNQRAKFESLEQIKAFLYLSIRNRCINFIKHTNIKRKYVQTVKPDTDTSFDDFVVEAEVAQNLNNAINSLPEQQKQVMILSIQGLKNEEIAQSMRISINTVKLYKKNAYQQLRIKLGPTLFLLLLFYIK
jgi:RNA polymerase sigma-70 factor (family 1)